LSKSKKEKIHKHVVERGGPVGYWCAECNAVCMFIASDASVDSYMAERDDPSIRDTSPAEFAFPQVTALSQTPEGAFGAARLEVITRLIEDFTDENPLFGKSADEITESDLGVHWEAEPWLPEALGTKWEHKSQVHSLTDDKVEGDGEQSNVIWHVVLKEEFVQ
jgi:hypothetical protein